MRSYSPYGRLFIKAAKGSQKQLHNSNDEKSLDEFKEAIQRSRAESQALGHNKIQEMYAVDYYLSRL